MIFYLDYTINPGAQVVKKEKALRLQNDCAEFHCLCERVFV